jgi:stage V sporulation protein R
VSDWSLDDLKKWDDKICKIAESYNLDWFPISYEICDYYEMIGHMSYHGMPSHYSHWSYGKSFERTHQMYNLGMEGLPYELIINSNPAIAYLMRENSFHLQIMIMAHCVGHSDFFKNNRIFEKTSPDRIVTKMRNSKKRIQKYSENTNIGYHAVESFLDSIHAIRFQTERNRLKRLSKKELDKKYVDLINADDNSSLDIEKTLLEPDYDLLSFLIDYGNHFKDWQLDLLNIVRDESWYFIPQIQTKILNEGWACFWHYKIINELDLPQKYHIPFLKSHNQVVRPRVSSINPYHVGFYLFNKVEKEKGLDECFFIREIQDDASAINCHLDIEDFRKLNLFTYSVKKNKISIDDISDEEGWKAVRSNLLNTIGINSIPRVYVSDISKEGNLILNHDHDGRDLDLEFAEEVVINIRKLWDRDVKFLTIIEDESFEI